MKTNKCQFLLLAFLFLLLLLPTGCTKMPIQRHNIKVERLIDSKRELTRADKFKNCILDLNKQGLKQSLIKGLCNATFGSIE